MRYELALRAQGFGQSVIEKFGKNASEDDVNNVRKNMGKMKHGPLAKIWDKVTTLWNAFNSPETPKQTKAIIIGGLIYMVCPIDLIPDAIPAFGLIDDAGVLGLIYNQYIQLVRLSKEKEDE